MWCRNSVKTIKSVRSCISWAKIWIASFRSALNASKGQFHPRVCTQLLRMQIPKAQKYSQLKQLFTLLGSASIKAARKHVDEIDPKCLTTVTRQKEGLVDVEKQLLVKNKLEYRFFVKTSMVISTKLIALVFTLLCICLFSSSIENNCRKIRRDCLNVDVEIASFQTVDVLTHLL